MFPETEKNDRLDSQISGVRILAFDTDNFRKECVISGHATL